MQLHQLRYVLAVAEERSFTRAAARLRVAQPSVSSAVRALEHELGAPLFERTRTAVTVTEAGATFLPWARQALADCEAGRDGVRDLLGLRRGRLSLGATPSLTTMLLPAVLASFHDRYPGVVLHLREAGSRDLVDMLEQRELDLALVILPVLRPWVVTERLADEELVLAVAAGHRLAGRAMVEVEELRDVALVMFRDGYDLREVTEAACRQAGFEPSMALEGAEMDGVLALAAAGLGGAVVPAGVLPPDGPLVAVPFPPGALSRTVGVAAHRDRPASQAAQALRAELRAAFRPPGPPAAAAHRPGMAGAAATGRPGMAEPGAARLSPAAGPGPGR